MDLQEAILVTIDYVSNKCKWRGFVGIITSILNGTSKNVKSTKAPTYGKFPGVTKYSVKEEIQKLCFAGTLERHESEKGPNKPFYTINNNVFYKQVLLAGSQSELSVVTTKLANQNHQNVFLCRMSNKNKAKEFTKEEFQNIDCHNDKLPSKINDDIIVKAFDKTFFLTSEYEQKFLLEIERKKLAFDCGTNLMIKYDTERRKDNDFYIDFVVYTSERHIALVEIKNVSSISNHIVLSKYKALRDYARKHDYEFMLYAPEENITMEELKSTNFNVKLRELFMSWLYDSSSSCITDEVVSEWLDKCKDQNENINELKKQVHGLIIKYKLFNIATHGFKVYRTWKDAPVS